MKTNCKIISYLISLMLLIGMGACGSAVVSSDPNVIPPAINPPPSAGSEVLPPKITQVVRNALNLGSYYPPDLDIPNIEGLKNYAFVTTYDPAVIAVNLNTNPLSVDLTKGLPTLSSVGSFGFVTATVIKDASHAYVLGTEKLVMFNPSNGNIYGTMDFTGSITIDPSDPLVVKNGDGSPAGYSSGSFTPFYPQGIAVSGNKLYISFANLTFNGFGMIDKATQSVVRIYDIVGDSLSPAAIPYVATNGFNATGLTVLENGNILITNSGIGLYDSTTFAFNPTIPAVLDLLDTDTSTISESVGLGLSYPSFKSWAVSPDGNRAFLGSATAGIVLEVALNPLELKRGLNNPILISSQEIGSDYLSDVAISSDGGGLFVASSNNSKIYAVDLTQDPPILTDQVADFSSPPGVVGIGAMAFRPGQVGVDYTGPDLFLLTNNPGTMGAIFTY